MNLISKYFTYCFDLFDCILALGATVVGLESKVGGTLFSSHPVDLNWPTVYATTAK